MLDEKIKVNIALMYGDLDYISMKDIDIKNEMTSHYLEKSCKFGHQKILEYLLDKEKEKENEIQYLEIEKLFSVCCEYGRLYMAKYLLQKYPNISVEKSNAIFYSLENNYVKTSKWLFFPYNREYIKKCITICLKKQNVEFIKWIIDNYTTHLNFINDIFIICIKNDYILKYILTFGTNISNQFKLQYAMEHFCQKDDLDSIKILFTLSDKYDFYNCLLYSIISKNKTNVFDYLLEKFEDEIDTNLLIKLIIINENEYFLKKVIHKYYEELDKDELFYFGCIYGMIDILKVFYHEDMSLIQKCYQLLLDNNHFNCIKWITPFVKEKIDFQSLDFKFVRNIDIISYLSKNDYDIKINDELFEKALKYSYLDLINILCELYPTKFKYDKSRRKGFILQRTKYIDEQTCHICLSELKKKVLLNCGHLFCDDCINEWLKKKYTCPICRTNIRNIMSMS